MPDKNERFILYRIYYADKLVYVGRTKQPLQSRIRGHLFKKPMHRTLDIFQISRIEFSELATEADMNLYEIYYILCTHPALNVDDKTRDYPTVVLPELKWTEWKTHLWTKWLDEIRTINSRYETSREEYNRIQEELRILRSLHRTRNISDDEFEEQYCMKKERAMILAGKLRG